jgi:transmembrane sensor
MTAPRSFADQAAAWLVRRDRGLTPAEQDEFLQWLAADPRHGEALAREQQTWRELDGLAEWRPEHATEPNPDLLARPARVGRRGARRKFWLAPITLAAAAAVALGTFVLRPGPPATATATEAAPGAAIASAYEQRVLEDGSLAELNRGAAIRVRFTAGERRVRLLRGEAHFTVKSQAGRPFVVEAGGVEARALGTAFQVRLGDRAVEVLVTAGRVQVAPPASAEAGSAPNAPDAAAMPVVGAGERIVVPLAETGPAPQARPVSADELARALAWQPRLLEFSAAPLEQVLAEFNRHNTVQLVLADPALARLPVVASFRSDNVEGFVRLLEVTAHVTAERQGGTIVLCTKRAP